MQTSRRIFLQSSLATCSLVSIFSEWSRFVHAASADDGKKELLDRLAQGPVRPADLSKIGVDAFADDELDLPFYLANFHLLANSVLMAGKDKGFISLPVWRNVKDNKPYNARIMESILSLAFFYVTDRPWNTFRGDPELHKRLEASLAFWCDAIKDGRFREYSETGYNLAATAFATKFMGETLWLLHRENVKIDAGLLDRVKQCDRAAIERVLTDPKMLETGRTYSNQYTNVYAGGLAYLDLFDDEALRKTLLHSIRTHGADFQSPAGYFYEKGGPDWSYNLGTHHSNLRMCHFYAREKEAYADILQAFLEEERKYVEWFAENAVREPNENVYILNKAVETRQSMAFWRGYGPGEPRSRFLPNSSPLVDAFLLSRENQLAWQQATRKRLQSRWPNVGSLKVGGFDSFSPYRFLHRRHVLDNPTDTEKREAIARLPYLAKDRWTRQRLDSRVATCFTYIRRPGYYLIFNSGVKGSKQQRLGIGLCWTPQYGTFLQNPSASSEWNWGTLPPGGKHTMEADSFTPRFSLAQKSREKIAWKAINPRIGVHDMEIPDGKILKIEYELGKNGKYGKKSLVFDEQVTVTVEAKGPLTEWIPLLAASEKTVKMVKENGSDQVILTGKNATLKLEFHAVGSIVLEKTDVRIASKRLFILRVHASGPFGYVIRT